MKYNLKTISYQCTNNVIVIIASDGALISANILSCLEPFSSC